MKKLNDLECPGCGRVEKDVFTETVDGKETISGQNGEIVSAVCDQCGAELKKVLPRLNIGGKASEGEGSDSTDNGEDSGVDDSAGSLVGKRLFTLVNPITGDTLTPIVKSARVIQMGSGQAIDMLCKAERGVMPNKLN